MHVRIEPFDAFIAVDVQNDFCPGGALAVPRGDEVVPLINRALATFHAGGRLVALTRDWHPPRHVSFAERGGPWPPHCVRDTPGAEFHPALVIPSTALIFSKGTAADKDAYSGFEGTGLADRLRELGVSRLVIAGLATDYCVKATALDAVKEGFGAVVIEDACRGIDKPTGNVARALDEMLMAGVIMTRLDEVS